jgi:hypothetical protein
MVLLRHVFRASRVRHVDVKCVAVFSGLPFLSVALHCDGSPTRHAFFYLGGAVSDPLLPRSFPAGLLLAICLLLSLGLRVCRKQDCPDRSPGRGPPNLGLAVSVAFVEFWP